MTKAIVCIQCVDLRMLRPEGPVSCQCGNVTGEWIDAQAGTCRITAADLDGAALLGLHNGFLLPALAGIRDGEVIQPRTRRRLHNEATNSPGYYFDLDRHGCWAILVGHNDGVSGVEWVRRE